jgi:hypothetical protein
LTRRMTSRARGAPRQALLPRPSGRRAALQLPPAHFPFTASHLATRLWDARRRSRHPPPDRIPVVPCRRRVEEVQGAAALHASGVQSRRREAGCARHVGRRRRTGIRSGDGWRAGPRRRVVEAAAQELRVVGEGASGLGSGAHQRSAAARRIR